MKKYHYLYELRLKSDPRYYYRGKHSTDNLNDGYIGSGSRVKQLLQEYGKDCFTKTVYKFCKNLQEVLQEEELYVGTLWKTDPFCLNLTPGGAFSGKFDMTGVPVRPETREKERKNRLGKKASEETKQKISKIHKGKKLTQEHILKIVQAHLGVPRKESTKQKVSAALKGKPKSLEHIKKMKECKLGRIWINNGNSSKLLLPEVAEEYLKQGWVRGRIQGQSRPKGMQLVYIHKGSNRKQVKSEDLQFFLENGWKKGFNLEKGAGLPEKAPASRGTETFR